MRSVPEIVASTVIIAAIGFLSSQAHAAPSLWDHNGSVMQFEEKGQKRRFIYEEPRRALTPAGVKTGTVLFDGEEKKDGRLAGYAKLFRKGCDPVDYFVEGAYDKAKGEILLQGQAPIYTGNGCKITGYTDEGSASSLRFTRLTAPDRNVARNDETGGGSLDQRAPSYLPPRSEQRADREPAYADPRDEERDPVYGRYSRDYASRRGRFRRYDPYDRAYEPDPYLRDAPDDDDYYDDEDQEPAYVPFRPWRFNRF
jgi:hypothetical protein